MSLGLIGRLKEFLALLRLVFIGIYYRKSVLRSGIIVVGSKVFRERIFEALSWIESRSKTVQDEITDRIRFIFETSEARLLPDKNSAICKFKKDVIELPLEILAGWLLFQVYRIKLYQEYCEGKHVKKAPDHVWKSTKPMIDCSRSATAMLRSLGAPQEILNSYDFFHEGHIAGIKP